MRAAGEGFPRGADLRLDCDFLVLDEVSMVDVPLMAAVLKALPDHAALLLIGDVDPLPSVGPGQLLADLIESGGPPVACLTEIFRQAAASRIITTAHDINRGTLPDLAPPSDASDFDFVEDAAAKIVKVVAEGLSRRAPHNGGTPARLHIGAGTDRSRISPRCRGRDQVE